jgi:uncharacterized membrane protein
MKLNKRTIYLTQAAMIAALYIVLTYAAHLLGLASQAIQIRFSEALTILPFFTAAAVPGLTVGCLLANFLTGCHWLDIIFGSLATLLGAVFTYMIGKKRNKGRLLKWLAPLPPIFFNTLIIPFVLVFVYGNSFGLLGFFFLTVGGGQIISCGVLGMALLLALEKRVKCHDYS